MGGVHTFSRVLDTNHRRFVRRGYFFAVHQKGTNGYFVFPFEMFFFLQLSFCSATLQFLNASQSSLLLPSFVPFLLPPSKWMFTRRNSERWRRPPHRTHTHTKGTIRRTTVVSMTGWSNGKQGFQQDFAQAMFRRNCAIYFVKYV